MNIVVLIIVVTGISNMIADIFLVSGKNHKQEQTKEDRINNTPYKHLHISGILGLISIAFWVTPLYYLKELSGPIATLAMFSFVMMIMSIQTFHVVCSYVMICYKLNSDGFDIAKTGLKLYGGVCILLSLIYTGSMIYLSVTDVINLNIIQYITLPFFSTAFFQVILRIALKKIPHYTSVAGTLGMMISLLGTVSIFLR